MNKHKKSERGQALILIVFAIIGLIGMTGLTVDGGIAFSDRRNAQNAADTAALAAGRMAIRSGDWDTARAAGFDLAANNGYDNNGTTNIVQVEHPPILGLYAGDDEYVQVLITSHVQTSFARVVGITEMTNVVNAVAKVIPSTEVHMFEGNAVVGLSPDQCKAVKYQGNADTTLDGGGIYVNSDCPNTAFFNNSASAELTAPSLCAVGGITYEPNAIQIPSDQIKTGCDAYDYPVPDYVMPLPECGGAATVTGNTMSPGTYTSNQAFPPNGVEVLEPGVYCVDANFTLNGGDTLTGDNVIIYMIDGDVTWNGGAEIHLSAPTSGPFENLVLYVPYENEATIRINGSSSSSIDGTILAPASDVVVDGTGQAVDGGGINGQIIGYTVDLSGTSNIDIYYDQNKTYEATTPPYLQLTE
ncbi:MAG: hypothetical protein HYZ22_09470 [Chloroflexi bacterium]|nr:hypothetical protein [Chloroflexota bacterium]